MNSKDHSYDYMEVTTAPYKGQVLLSGGACKHYASKLPSAAPGISPAPARAELSPADIISPNPPPSLAGRIRKPAGQITANLPISAPGHLRHHKAERSTWQ